MTSFDIYASALVTAPSGDPQYFFTTSCLPEMSYNFGAYENETVNELIHSLSTEFDTAKRADQLMYKDKNLYPIYIVLSFSDTFFGNIIKKVKHCTYSHAGLTKDSDLREIVTFKFNVGKANGFTIEKLDTYLSASNDAIISLLLAFLGIIIYVSIRYTFSYAISGLVALLHDVFVIFMIFSLFKTFFLIFSNIC